MGREIFYRAVILIFLPFEMIQEYRALAKIALKKKSRSRTYTGVLNFCYILYNYFLLPIIGKVFFGVKI